jgi:hypothetical protein
MFVACPSTPVCLVMTTGPADHVENPGGQSIYFLPSGWIRCDPITTAPTALASGIRIFGGLSCCAVSLSARPEATAYASTSKSLDVLIPSITSRKRSAPRQTAPLSVPSGKFMAARTAAYPRSRSAKNVHVFGDVATGYSTLKELNYAMLKPFPHR